MSNSDWVQIITTSIASIIAAISAVFSALALRGLRKQVDMQNILMKAQLIKDRYEMYRTVLEPITSEQVEDLHLFPEDYMDLTKYRREYQDDPIACRRYVSASNLYEYLAFTYELQDQKIPDPLGSVWVHMWVRELVGRKEFRDVHDSYKAYYPEFARMVESYVSNQDATEVRQ